MNNFEFNAKADEWLDVTSCEEILRNELNHTRNFLETKQMELLELSVTIDLLKGHKALLENERESLREDIRETKETLATTIRSLEEMTVVMKATDRQLNEVRRDAQSKIQTLEESLTASESNLKTCYSQIRSLEQETVSMKREQTREQNDYKAKISAMNALNEKLKSEVLDGAAIRKKQQEQIVQLQKALGDSRTREEGLRQQVDKQSQIMEQRDAEIKETKHRIGSVSVLAQSLKEKNNSLVCSMFTVQKCLNESVEKLNASTRREADLHGEFAQLKSEAKEKQVLAVRDFLAKMEQAEDRIAGLESYAEDLKEQVVAISEERDSMLDRLADKEAENVALAEDKESLAKELKEKTRGFMADLEHAKNSIGREESLKAELEKQKAFFDARLTEIRTILGVSAIAEIKKEISTVGKIYVEHQHRIRSCPSVKSPTLRVPLMFGMQHQKAN